jgi:hypothetical protein
MAIFGYARVSTRDQDVAARVAELITAGCAKVYREKRFVPPGDREPSNLHSARRAGDQMAPARAGNGAAALC